MADNKLGISAQSTPTIDLSVNRAFVEMLPLLQKTFPTLVREFPGIFQEGQPNPEIPDAFKKRTYELMAEFFRAMNRQYEPIGASVARTPRDYLPNEYRQAGLEYGSQKKSA